MSLFERIQNKRYDLQEAPIDDKGRITPEPGDIKKEKKIVKKFNKQQKKIEQKNININKKEGDKLLQDINKRKSADLTRADAINKSMGTSGSTEGAGGASGSKTVNQADVSKKAQEFTKEIEKKRVKKLAPIDLKKPTERVDLRKVERKISRKRPSNAPSLADIQKKIDVKNPVEIGKTGSKPVKGSVLRVLKKGEVPSKSVMQQNVPKGFERVLKKDAKAQEILKKQVKTAQLVDPKPIKPKSSTIKPNLFGRIKNFVKGEPKIPSDYKLVRGTANQPLSVTRKVYKGKLGAVRKFVDKLPRKYKLAGTALLATAAIAPNIKNPFAPKAQKKSYTVASKKLKLDTGKKNT